eukprot:5195819-Amphidinium_carterae.1
MLECKGLGKRVAAGTGFHVPPCTNKQSLVKGALLLRVIVFLRLFTSKLYENPSLACSTRQEVCSLCCKRGHSCLGAGSSTCSESKRAFFVWIEELLPDSAHASGDVIFGLLTSLDALMYASMWLQDTSH